MPLTGRAGPASRRAGRRSCTASEGARPIIMPSAAPGASMQFTGRADLWHPTRPASACERRPGTGRGRAAPTGARRRGPARPQLTGGASDATRTYRAPQALTAISPRLACLIDVADRFLVGRPGRARWRR
jgi:hypothetical protein